MKLESNAPKEWYVDLDADKLSKELEENVQVWLNPDALMSPEYYDLKEVRNKAIEDSDFKKYLISCYEVTQSANNNAIFFAWLVEALVYMYGIFGLAKGLSYLKVLVDHVASIHDQIDPESMIVFIKQLLWLGEKVAGPLKFLLLVNPSSDHLYTYMDYLMIVYPDRQASHILEEEDEKKPLEMDQFNAIFDQTSLERMKSFYEALESANNSIKDIESTLQPIIQALDLPEDNENLFFPIKEPLEDITELFGGRIKALEGPEESDELPPMMGDDAASFPGGPMPMDGGGGPARISSPEDVKEALTRCMEYLEAEYQHTPVLMLLKTAHQWLGMNFEGIINMMMQKNTTLEALFTIFGYQPPPPQMPPGGGGFGGPPGGGMPPGGGGGFGGPPGGGYDPGQY